MKAKYKAILFDLDGTLLDSAPDLISTTQRLLKEEEKSFVTDDILRPCISDGAQGLIMQAFGSPADNSLKKLRRKFVSYYSQNPLKYGSKLFSGLEVISDLLHNTPWGIVTNKSRLLTKPIIESFSTLNSCNVLVCGDDCEEMKPHHQPVSYACSELGVAPEETIFIGDSIKDILAGKGAGTATAAVFYGYRSADDNPYEWEAGYYIRSPKDLIDFIKSLIL